MLEKSSFRFSVLSEPATHAALRGGASHRCNGYIRTVCEPGGHFSTIATVLEPTENGDSKREANDVLQVLEN